MNQDFRVDVPQLEAQAELRIPPTYSSGSSHLPYPGPSIANDHREFRLLLLEPLPITNDPTIVHESPIYGDLVVRNLEECPIYIALSYVWGQSEPENPRTIRIRKSGAPENVPEEVAITENGYQALKQIRKVFGGISIWIDAICINQSDDKERSHQVRMMGDIYSTSQRVVVWLGVGNAGVYHAMRFLRAVGNSSERMPFEVEETTTGPKWKDYRPRFDWRLCKDRIKNLPWTLGARYFHRTSKSQKGFLQYLMPGRVVSDLDIRSVLENEWLTRSWTLPEFILARDSILICGDEQIPWQEFLGCIWRGPLKNFPQTAQWQALAQAWLSLPREETSANGIRQKYTMRERLHPSKATPFLTDPKLGYYVIVPIIAAGITALAWYLYEEQGIDEKRYLIPVPIGVVLISASAIYLLLRVLYGANRGSELPLKSYDNDAVFEIISSAILNRQCARPHDKCFSLYGVLARHGIDMGEVDYDVSPQKVYNHFFSKLIQHNPRALSLLVDASHFAHVSSSTNNSSWAINLDAQHRPRWLPKQFILGSRLIKINAMPPLVNTDLGILRIPAISLGIITFRTDFTAVYESHKGAAKDLAKEALVQFLLFLEHIPDNYITRPWRANQKSHHFLFFRSVMMPEVWLKWNQQHNHSRSRGGGGKHGPPHHNKKFGNKSELHWWKKRSSWNLLANEYKQFFIPLLKILRNHRQYRSEDIMSKIKTLTQPREKSIDSSSTMAAGALPQKFVDKMYRAIKNKKKIVAAFNKWCQDVAESRRRAFFTTASGFPATGGMDINIGDELFYVPNAPALMVLRKGVDGLGYVLVGPASGPLRAGDVGDGMEMRYVDIY